MMRIHKSINYSGLAFSDAGKGRFGQTNIRDRGGLETHACLIYE